MVWQDASHINAVFCTKTVVNTIAPTFCLGSGFFFACLRVEPPAHTNSQNAKSLFALCGGRDGLHRPCRSGRTA